MGGTKSQAETLRLTTGSEAETESLGSRLVEGLRAGDAVFLDGELGAGKSVIARGIARAMGVTDWRGSPTFTIVNEYGTRPALYHIDLYRLNAGEAAELGLDEYFRRDSIVVVEWAQRSPNYLTDLVRGRVYWVHLRTLEDNQREISLTVDEAGT